MRNIILCGFMGCGKSTVGRLLAKQTNRPFVDMDDYIERQSGITVPEIFSQFGEAEFRKRESAACRALSQKQNLIIAAGGGALTFPENVNVLAKTGDIVLLNVPLAVILHRLEADATRPLLNCPDKESAAKELYDHRLPLYRAAAKAIVDADDAPESVVDVILRALQR